MKKLTYLLLLALPILMLSCSEKLIEITGTEEDQINNYIAAKKLVVTEKTPSGLRFCLTKSSKGSSLKLGQSVNVDYKGTLMSGQKFDSGNFSFLLGVGQVVKGFDEGIAKMKVGEKAVIVFPSNLGYGTKSVSSIPSNSPLAFTITVVSAK
jgi:FKBP-type peptidyl-prolyl cis-trans isomerase